MIRFANALQAIKQMNLDLVKEKLSFRGQLFSFTENKENETIHKILTKQPFLLSSPREIMAEPSNHFTQISKTDELIFNKENLNHYESVIHTAIQGDR